MPVTIGAVFVDNVLLALRAARLFDGESLRTGPVMILTDNGRIVDVDFTGAHPPEGWAFTDLGDVTVMPGLVDAHSHLVFDPDGHAERQMVHDDDETVLARMRGHAARALRAGVTTVRDLGDRGYLALRLRDEFAAGVMGPHIVASGPPLTLTRGHCWYLGGEADDAEQAVAAVAARARRGADLVKVMATGGMSTTGSDPGGSQYDLAALRAVTEAAHRLGLPVTAHAHGAAGIADAVAAGVDGVEHCTFITASGVRPDPATVDAMAAAGTFVGATVVRPREGMPAEVLRTIEPYWRNQEAMHRRGVRVVCCTDAGINPHKPHDVLPGDLAYFASQVAPNVEALASVTSLAALSCGLGDRKGRIAPGRDADLLVIPGNPVHDIAAVREVRAVYRAGRPVKLD
ncbi:amidohydrolase family protein [Streptomyces cinnamoneus]|uniref:amidohydrolase family protein n=1 Tax=Streptomyces cinnamoneus TaxID=53446 RepID=UPI00195F7B2B|nr:amidohydrolase family protein [Streptomyces cinnamoneus]